MPFVLRIFLTVHVIATKNRKQKGCLSVKHLECRHFNKNIYKLLRPATDSRLYECWFIAKLSFWIGNLFSTAAFPSAFHIKKELFASIFLEIKHSGVNIFLQINTVLRRNWALPWVYQIYKKNCVFNQKKPIAD